MPVSLGSCQQQGCIQAAPTYVTDFATNLLLPHSMQSECRRGRGRDNTVAHTLRPNRRNTFIYRSRQVTICLGSSNQINGLFYPPAGAQFFTSLGSFRKLLVYAASTKATYKIE
ncbi:hypothetical protein PAXRUDRAFT_685425 [Paxillus rubicundulus Ve08.2h10]|uniref:Uncharacterized protein n=1 Tax=Paxillus rubicundulus Ve08.2h10 TaxID=930991 RepID=A0A0D0DV45_9AGAM|nr:hypothetical protein PAXRUDRAFT_685425 [Paxillus rubicundulus Ve08.2h10]